MKSDKNLEILKVRIENDNQNEKVKNIHENLLKPPFLLVINGSVKTGKSNMIMNFLYNKSFYKDVFDDVYFISPTIHNDKTLTVLNNDDDIHKISENLDKLDTILETIVQHIDKKAERDSKGKIKENTLIVLDDMLGYIKPNSYASYLCTRYRHYGISLICTSQSFKKIPNVIRENASGYLLFKAKNKKEYKKITEEMDGLHDNFEEYFKLATKDPYNFLFVNIRDVRFFHNFTEELH